MMPSLKQRSFVWA